jgi:transposase
MSKLINNLGSEQLWVGVDVSKLTLSIAYCKDGKKDWYEANIENSEASIRLFWADLAQIKALSTISCIFEFTGTYNSALMYVLADLNVKMSVITPAQSSAFANVLKDSTKTDSRDARRLVLYGDSMAPECYTPPSADKDEFKQLLVLLTQYAKQILAKGNQLEALLQRPQRSAFIQKSLEADIAYLTAQKAAVEAEIYTARDDAFNGKIALLTTIKGVGEVVATNVLIQTGGMETFTDVKQVIKFAGLAPSERQSGTSLHQKGIIKGGNGSLRKILYLAAWSASRFNPACKELYLRLREKGKPRMLALIAVAHKLLRQIWGVLKSNTPFDPVFHLPKTAK